MSRGIFCHELVFGGSYNTNRNQIQNIDLKGIQNEKIKYYYNICTDADEKVFNEQCKALEKFIPDLKKGKQLQDVDCSKIQYYSLGENELRVNNDYAIKSIYIESDFDIDIYFK